MFSKALKKLLSKKIGEKETTSSSPISPKTDKEIILDHITKFGVEDKDAKNPSNRSNHTPFDSLKKSSNKANPNPKRYHSSPQVDLTIFEEEQSSSSEILEYLDSHGVEYKESDSINKQASKPRSTYRKRGAEEMRVDLHGLTVEEAERMITNTINSANRDGIKQILLVHGRGKHTLATGRAILKERVHVMLNRELEYLIESYKFAPGKEGGDGATRIFLK